MVIAGDAQVGRTLAPDTGCTHAAHLIMPAFRLDDHQVDSKLSSHMNAPAIFLRPALTK